MDQAKRDLIVQLSTRAGMAMEDVCTEAILLGSCNIDEFPKVLEDIDAKINEMKTLISAAQALCK